MTIKEIKLTHNNSELQNMWFRREYWGDSGSGSLMGFIENGEPMFFSRGNMRYPVKLEPKNRAANDWYECDIDGIKIEKPADRSLKFTYRGQSVKNILNRMNNKIRENEEEL